MKAAIYARKSTAQHVQADDKSTARQIENATKFAASKGWTVSPEHIYSDDGISGAETTKLVQKHRMLAAAARGEFQILVLQSVDRFSRRPGVEALAELQALAKHVTIWCYLEGTPFDGANTLSANVMNFLKQEIAADHRRTSAQKAHEAHRLKAERGYVTGNRTFGYDNLPVYHGAKRSHVERRINAAEADVVKAIYDRYAKGEGFKGIAHALNGLGLPAPRPQRGRPSGWDPGSVRAILRRPIYRGVVMWDRTKKRDDTGLRHKGRQPKKATADVFVGEFPEFRIVDAATVALVDERLTKRRNQYLRNQKGQLLGSPRHHNHNPARHLLAGFIVCQCGANFEAVKGYYICSARRRKGPSVCTSETTFSVEGMDNVFLDAVESVVLSPRYIDQLVDDAFAHDPDADRIAWTTERATVAREITNITTAIAKGGDIPALADALKTRDARLRVLDGLLAKPTNQLTKDTLKAALELRTADWRDTLRGPHLDQARLILQHVLDLPIRVKNLPKPKWVASAKPEGLLVGLVHGSVASPRGFPIHYQPIFKGIWVSDRAA